MWKEVITTGKHTMSHENCITKIKICWSLYENGVCAEAIPYQIGVHRATVYRWVKGIKLKGIRRFLKDYENAKKGRRQRKTVVIAKLRIYEIRKKYHECCGEKIK